MAGWIVLLVSNFDTCTAESEALALLKRFEELVRSFLEEGTTNLIASLVEQVNAEELARSARVFPCAHVTFVGQTSFNGPSVLVRIQTSDGLYVHIAIVPDHWLSRTVVGILLLLISIVLRLLGLLLRLLWSGSSRGLTTLTCM